MSENEDLIKIAFQAENAVDDEIIQKFGKVYPPKKVLIHEGETNQNIFWILSGEVYVTKKTGKGYKVLTSIGEGNLVGEMSFFDKTVRTATVISKTEVKVLVFSRENFADIYSYSPQWLVRLLKSLSLRAKVMVEKLK